MPVAKKSAYGIENKGVRPEKVTGEGMRSSVRIQELSDPGGVCGWQGRAALKESAMRGIDAQKAVNGLMRMAAGKHTQRIAQQKRPFFTTQLEVLDG